MNQEIIEIDVEKLSIIRPKKASLPDEKAISEFFTPLIGKRVFLKNDGRHAHRGKIGTLAGFGSPFSAYDLIVDVGGRRVCFSYFEVEIYK